MNVCHNERIKDMRAGVKQMAAESFKDHVIKQVAEERWKCWKRVPCECNALEHCKKCDGKRFISSWNYGFFVVVAGGTVIVYGDIGDAIFHSGAHVRDLVREDSYLLGKMCRPEKDFYPKEVLASIEFDIAELKKERDQCVEEGEKFDRPAELFKLESLLEEARELEAAGELYEHTAYELFEEHGQQDIGESLRGAVHYDSRCYWIAEALRVFVRLRDAAEGHAATP